MRTSGGVELRMSTTGEKRRCDIRRVNEQEARGSERFGGTLYDQPGLWTHLATWEKVESQR